MRALGYISFGKSEQSFTKFSQKFALFCEKGNHANLGFFGDDKDINSRTEFESMISHINSTSVGYLVVIPDASHLGDSLQEQVNRILELDALHCQVVCDDENLPDPLQSAMKILSGSGTGSRRERIREGMKAKAARGLGLGKPPYGFMVQFDGSFRLIEREAEVIRSIFKMYLEENIGVRTIAQRLNEERKRTRSGNRWSMVTVRDILRNHSYIGTYQRFGLRITGNYQPVVDPADFRQVQDKMASRSPGRRQFKNESFLLSGLLYCGNCGQRMMGVLRKQAWNTKNGDRRTSEYRYYQCQSRINRNQCDYRTVKARVIEEEVVNQLRQNKLNTDQGSINLTDHEIQASASKIKSIDRRYIDYIRMAASGAVPLERIKPALKELESTKSQLKEMAAIITESGFKLDEVIESSKAKIQKENWENLELSERIKIINTLMLKATIRHGNVDVTARG